MQVLQSLLGGGGGGGGKGKGGKGNRGNMGMISRTAKTNPERVVWIGGLEGKTLDKEACKKLRITSRSLQAKVASLSASHPKVQEVPSSAQMQRPSKRLQRSMVQSSWARLWKLTSGPRRKSSDHHHY